MPFCYSARVVVGPVNLSGSAGELRGRHRLWCWVLGLLAGTIALLCGGASGALAAISPDPLTAEERAWVVARQPLRYAPQSFNPPYELQASNSVAGIAPELLGLIATNLGVEITNVVVSGSATDAVLLGKADLTGAFASTVTREALFEFTSPYLWASNFFYVRAGSGISDSRELAHKRVGVVLGRAAHEWIAGQSMRIQLVPVATSREGMLLLSTGHLDGLFDMEWPAERAIVATTLHNIRRLPGSPFGTPQQFAVAESNAILARILQKGLDTISAEQRSAIVEAWRPNQTLDKGAHVPRWFWEVLAGSGIIALGLLLWNLALRREVARRTRALKESEEHFRVLYENAPVAYHSMDERGQLLEVNAAWLELLGYTRQEVAGRSVTDFLDPSSASSFKEMLSRLRRSQRVSGTELRFRCRKGEELIFSVEARADGREEGRAHRAHCVLHNITERQRAVAAVQQTEARLSAAQRIARLGTWEMALQEADLARNPMWWSDEVYRLLGHTAGEAKADFETFVRHIPEAERGLFTDTLTRGLASCTSCELDHRVTRRDGTELFVHQHVEVLCDSAGTPARLAGTLQDITERKQAEEQIRSLNARLESRLVALTQPLGDLSGVRFQDLFDLDEIQRIQDAFASAAGVASIITDVDGRPITRPSNFCRLCEHIIRKTDKGFANCCHSDAVLGRKNEHGPIMQRCLSGGLWDAGSSICVGDRHVANWLIGQVLDSSADEESMLGYAREIGADPEEFRRALAEVNRMPLEQFEKVTTALHLIARQLSRQAVQNVQQARFITERKRVQRELEEKQRFISAVAGNTPDYIVVFDVAEQRQVYTNRSMADLLGYTEEEVRSFAPNELFHVLHPEDAPRFMQHIRSLEKSPGSGMRSFEFRVRRRDGTYAWFLSRDVIFERDHAGKPRKILSVAQDVSERKEAEEKRAHLEAQLRQSQKMEAVGQLAGGVAHDFNNILAAMLMNLELLREVEALDEIRAGLQDLDALARRAATLTSQLLQFGRRQVLQRRSLDLNTLLLGLTKLLRRVIGEHITLECNAADAPLWVEADSGMLEQVVTNLAVNARDAMPNGGRIVLSVAPVTVDSRHVSRNPKARTGNFVRLEVSDNGCGMYAHTLSRIFEPFFTTKDVGKGTGLGLSTVYGVVEQHQGWVEVESELGKGSSFRVYLPRRESPCETQAPASAGAPARRGRETILVVEDEVAVRRLLARTLTAHGYVVLEAGHGQEALQCWERSGGKVDVLLSDVVMPEGLGGFELAKRLRGAKPELRVVLMSGYNAEMMSDGFEVPPGTAFLQKPFTPEVLASALRGVLDRAAQPARDSAQEMPGGR